jgi:hypothetical protein
VHSRCLAAYRIDIEGINTHPLNFQWAGTLNRLQEILADKGWKPAPAFGVLRAMNWLAPHPQSSTLPILYQVHDGRAQKLLLVRSEEGAERMTVLRVWPAGVEAADHGRRIWTGTVSYLYVDHSLRLISYLRTAPDFDSPLEVLRAALQGTTPVKMVERNTSAPSGMEWHGEVLLGWEIGQGPRAAGDDALLRP